MAKTFLVQFGTGNPGTTLNAGLSPTFILFAVMPSGALPTGGSAVPGITQLPNNAGGISTGVFYFTYEPLSPIAFVIDGGSAITTAAARYVSGALDPVQAVDERIAGLSSMIANQGTTLTGSIGSLADSFGTTLSDPTSVFGYLKRLQEWNEGDSTFLKTSGTWAVWSRGNTFILGASTYPGTSAMLTTKNLVDNGSNITKT